MKVKFLKKVTRKDGSINFFIAVPAYVEHAIGMKSQSFDTLKQASDYSSRISHLYTAHKLGHEGKVRGTRINYDTVNGLIERYVSSEDWRNLKDNSQRAYRLMFKTAVETHLPRTSMLFGQMQIENITREVVERFIEVIRANYSQHRLFHTIKVMRLVWAYGERTGYVDKNPWRNSRVRSVDRRQQIWSEDDIEAVISTADDLGLHSIGTMVMMCYQMCQRPGDVRQLTWEQLEGDVFKFAQEKTGTKVTIPISPSLKRRLTQYSDNRTGTIILYENTGMPFDKFMYYKAFRRVAKAAGISADLRMADLRRTGATFLAQQGCTEDEIMSITGHKVRETLTIYVNRTETTARNAMAKAWA